jgi:flagellum-specific peptidoglycan hydrolase FlgJ
MRSRIQAMKLRRNERAWSNRGFHLFIVLSLVLFTLTLRLVKVSAENVTVKHTTPVVKAAELISPAPIGSAVSPVPTTTPASKWLEFKQAAQKVAKIYNFPVKVILAQGALESAHGTSNYCVTRNNCLGIGAVDWNPDQAYTYENMEQSIVEYCRLIRKNFPQAWEARSNPDMVIFRLKVNRDGLMYATDPNYIDKVKSMEEWKQ